MEQEPASFLPLPLELISIVSDHQIAKGWLMQQSIHKATMKDYIMLVQSWPTKGDERYPNHARLHPIPKIDPPFWYYSSYLVTNTGAIPRPSIDELLMQKKDQ
jgi:hypothetical protein